MKFMKRLAALLVACVIAVTAFSVCCSAENDYFVMNVGDTITYSFSDNSRLRFLFVADYNGELTIRFNYTSVYFCGVLSGEDENNPTIRPTSIKASSGTACLLDVEEGSGFTMENYDGGNCACTVKYNVKKGYNLLTISNESADFPERREGGNITISLSMKNKSATLDRFSVSVSKGSTLQLGALLSDGTAGSVTWSSSKKSVAAVNSKGKVTAKAKGTAVITAKYGDSTMKITVVVK